jgi:D-glycero-D-manno-heptose 1,7-bisphosphate phosphatase
MWSTCSSLVNSRQTVDEFVSSRSERQWCLFVDRDGVINRRVVDGYVCSWDEFEFLPGAADALVTLARWAPHVVVVTNQQGVGKGVMSDRDLADIHTRMLTQLSAHGAHVDSVRFCPHLAASECSCRKPEPGLALAWLAEHASVEPRLSVMVGDSDSDMDMARALSSATGGCARVRITDDVRSAADCDVAYRSLAEFAADVQLILEDREK